MLYSFPTNEAEFKSDGFKCYYYNAPSNIGLL